jgi:hypothetical protein
MSNNPSTDPVPYRRDLRKKMDLEDKNAKNNNDDLQEDVRDTADETRSSLDETGDKIKAGAKAMGNKIKDPDRDMGAEYDKEKFRN